MYSAREKALIGIKWVASFLRRDWRLCHYPIRIRRSGTGAKLGEEWFAQILNWPGPVGVGASKEQAVEKLEQNLESVRMHRSATHEQMPRPGSAVPVQFAPTDRVSSDLALHDDFIIRVLGFAPGSPVFISDMSSLSDFGDEAYVVTLQKKIAEVYGVDVSDLKKGLLCEIFERIQIES